MGNFKCFQMVSRRCGCRHKDSSLPSESAGLKRGPFVCALGGAFANSVAPNCEVKVTRSSRSEAKILPQFIEFRASVTQRATQLMKPTVKQFNTLIISLINTTFWCSYPMQAYARWPKGNSTQLMKSTESKSDSGGALVRDQRRCGLRSPNALPTLPTYVRLGVYFNVLQCTFLCISDVCAQLWRLRCDGEIGVASPWVSITVLL